MQDTIDRRVLQLLMLHGRMTWSDLAERLGLSAPAAAERVRKLEERGVIKGYAALIDAESIGYGLMAFVAVTLSHPDHRATFVERVEELAEVQECHHVAGEDDYLLKVRARDTRDLERLLSHSLKSLPGIQRTRTTIVLSTVKEEIVFPLEPGSRGT